MMSITASITTRGMSLVRPSIKTSSRRTLLCNVESIQTIIGRRLLSSSGNNKNVMNSKNTAKINSIKEVSTKPATKGDAATTSKPFWKSFLEPKPMPERWTNAWVSVSVCVCVYVFLIWIVFLNIIYLKRLSPIILSFLIFLSVNWQHQQTNNNHKKYREMVLICTVFAITGSSTMILVS